MTSDRLSEARTALEGYRRTDEATPPNLFDAIAARDDAIGRVADSYRGELLAQLNRALEKLARARVEFTVDDLRDELDIPAGVVDLKVLGAVLRHAAKRGLIVAVGYTPSRYRHASPVRVWRSEIHDAS